MRRMGCPVTGGPCGRVADASRYTEATVQSPNGGFLTDQRIVRTDVCR